MDRAVRGDIVSGLVIKDLGGGWILPMMMMVT
jgi:hypothetical protein